MAAAKEGLSKYRGREVMRTSIAIKGAGDGLSKALGVDPVEYEPGSKQKHYIVLEVECESHMHKRIPDTNAFELKQTFVAGTATFVESDLVRDVIEAQEKRLEEAQGIQQLPWNTPADNADELMALHEAGEHANALRDGCPACIEERIAVENEKKAKRGK